MTGYSQLVYYSMNPALLSLCISLFPYSFVYLKLPLKLGLFIEHKTFRFKDPLYCLRRVHCMVWQK